MQMSSVSPMPKRVAPVYTTHSLTHLLHALHLANASLSRTASLLRTQPLDAISDSVHRLAVALSPRVCKSWSSTRCARLVVSHMLPRPMRRKGLSAMNSEGLETSSTLNGNSMRMRAVVRLIPTDAATREAVVGVGGHPYVEIVLRASKTVWDIMAHLFVKWGLPLRVTFGDGDTFAAPRLRLASFLSEAFVQQGAAAPSSGQQNQHVRTQSELSTSPPVLHASFQLAVPHIPPAVFKAARAALLVPDAPPSPPPLPPTPSRPPAASRAPTGARPHRTYAAPPPSASNSPVPGVCGKRRAACPPPCSPDRSRTRKCFMSPPASQWPTPSALSSPAISTHDNGVAPNSISTATSVPPHGDIIPNNLLCSSPSFKRRRSPVLSCVSKHASIQPQQQSLHHSSLLDMFISQDACETPLAFDAIPESLLSLGTPDDVVANNAALVDDSPPVLTDDYKTDEVQAGKAHYEVSDISNHSHGMAPSHENNVELFLDNKLKTQEDIHLQDNYVSVSSTCNVASKPASDTITVRTNLSEPPEKTQLNVDMCVTTPGYYVDETIAPLNNSSQLLTDDLVLQFHDQLAGQLQSSTPSPDAANTTQAEPPNALMPEDDITTLFGMAENSDCLRLIDQTILNDIDLSGIIGLGPTTPTDEVTGGGLETPSMMPLENDENVVAPALTSPPSKVGAGASCKDLPLSSLDDEDFDRLFDNEPPLSLPDNGVRQAAHPSPSMQGVEPDVAAATAPVANTLDDIVNENANLDRLLDID